MAGCADEPTRPPDAALSGETMARLAISAEQRGELHAALLFAREQSLLALERREAADDVASAFAALAGRVEQDDRVGVERAMAGARRAIERYREHARPDDAAVDLEAATLTLDHAAALAREGDPVRGGGRITPPTRNSREERQP
jgi:hypothetical protein